MPTPLQESAPVYPLRLPVDLDRRLRAWAKSQRCSLRDAIVSTLENALRDVECAAVTPAHNQQGGTS